MTPATHIRLFASVTLVGLMGLVGCATARDADVAYMSKTPARAPSGGALVFDPPVTAYAPTLYLDRSERMASAFVGYDSVTTYTFTRLDDRQSYYGSQSGGGSRGGGGRYRQSGSYVDRQSITETVGVREK